MKLLLRMLFLLMPGFLHAQDIDRASKSIYYEKYKTAAAMLHTVLKTEPTNVEAWYWLSQAYNELGQSQKFFDTLRSAPSQIAEEPLFKVILGEIQLKNNRKDSAALYFNQALKDTKQKNSFVLSAIANAHIGEKTGDGNYAIELLNKAVKRDKKNPALYTMMGDAYRKLNNGSEAFKMYQRALEIDPRYAAAAHKLGKIFFSQNNPVYLTYFNQAATADPNFAPVYYDLYYHYYFIDPSLAMANFEKYLRDSDYDVNNEYLYADLLYLNKDYHQAIDMTKKLMAETISDTMPRLHKLLAYSYVGLKDTGKAINEMEIFLAAQPDTSHISKDYEFLADLYASRETQKDSAIIYYQKVINTLADTSKLYSYYKKLADLSKETRDYPAHAEWMGKYYQHHKNASNLDLFNWGIAHFKAEQYVQADSVFALYTEKYPDQSYGYYWRARSNALLDSSMESGLAIPHYKQLIAIIEKDTSDATNKKWLIESYGYIAAYETNKEKDFEDAIEYLEKVLELDPENKNALQYITLLEKTVEAKDERN